MKFKKFDSDFKALRSENYWSRITILASIVIIGILSTSLASKKAVVTLVPPNMTEEAKVHHDKAQKGMHKAWSLYLAESLGNVTPETADFTRVSLDPLLSSRIRDDALVILERQIDQIKENQVSFSFEPREVQFHEDLNKTFVIGRHYTYASGNDPKRVSRTYEFKWEFDNYMPKLVEIDTYTGAPRL